MQKLFLFIVILCFCACTKSGTDYAAGSASKPFFKNADEVFSIVSQQVPKFHRGENLKTIDRISYLYSGKRAYAIVFYSSSHGSSNLVVRKDNVDDFAGGYTITKCNGSNCDCWVNAYISNDGNISISCSCSSCTMSTTQGLE